MAVDPEDLEQVGRALLAECRSHVADVELGGLPEPVQGGFDNYTYFFRLVGDPPDEWAKPLALRLSPNPRRKRQARDEAEVQAFCADRGYPAPRPLVSGGGEGALGLPFVIMERAPGRTMLAAVTANPVRAGSWLDLLAALHARLHSLSPSGFPLAADEPLVERMLRRMEEGYRDLGTPMDEGLGWLRSRAGPVTEEERRVCHNDFHPLNVMVDEHGWGTVLDWTNATLGDRHCDVARTLVLFSVAPLAARSRPERLALRTSRGWLARRYRRSYERLLPLDEGRLRYWMALHAFDGWGQVETLRRGGYEGDTRADSSDRVPATLGDGLWSTFTRLQQKHSP